MNRIKLVLVLLLFTVPVVKAETTTNAVTSSRSTYSSRTTTNNSYSYYDDDEYESSSSKTVTYGLSSTAIVKTNSSTGYKYFIDDRSDLLSESEEEQVFEYLEKCSEYGNAGFFSVNDYASDPDYYSKNLYHSIFGTASGTILVINMNIRQISVFSDGDNFNKVTTAKATSIVSNTYMYAHNEDYYRCVLNSFKQIYSLLSGKTIFEPMKMMSNAFIAITVAAFACYIYVLSTSTIKKAKGNALFNGIIKTVNISNINITKTGTRAVYNPPSSSSGGSSGGGGGHSSGGGASHGF